MKHDHNLDGLDEFCTVRQLEHLQALRATGSYRKAATLLGLTKNAIQQSIILLKSKAAAQGFSPEHDMTKVVPDGFRVKGVSTYYDDDGKVRGQWVKSEADAARREAAVKAWVEALCEDVTGRARPVDLPPRRNADLLAVYPWGDPHFGMYAWWQDSGGDFDLSEAERLTKAAVDRLVASAPPAQTAILLNLGDMFHADNQKNQSQSGHQLDVDGRWAKVQQVGLLTMVYCIQRMLEKHDNVVVRINRGNHDGHSSYALSLMLSCYFHEEPRVCIDLSPATLWYYRFGGVLIGSTHGDTIKGKDLMGVMAADKAEDWGLSRHRYFYVGHVHHHDSKEYPGGIVEYFRTLAARDAWHTGQGYRAGRDMCLIVHHIEHGEIERHRCDIGTLGGD